jgi:hypothetical protein
MRQAKDAAKGLVSNLFDGYDQVAVVEYSYDARLVQGLTSSMASVTAAINTIGVHNDAPAGKLVWYHVSPRPLINPIFPDDRDGDGLDADAGGCTDTNYDLWQDGEEGITPCDNDDVIDAFDMDWDGVYGEAEDSSPFSNGTPFEDTSLLSTCIGCGIREATDVLRAGGRPQSLWVILFLTDGIANLSDFPGTYDGFDIPSSFVYGFCGSNPGTSFWNSFCIDTSLAERYCIDDDPDECPPDTTHTTTSGPFSVEDYARDMVDRAALLFSDNEDEPLGEDIIIYAVGLSNAASGGAHLLRYMANIGDDGSRDNDPCSPGGSPLPYNNNCGNYFFSPSGAYLDQIFESIAGRIFTKISR